MLHKSETTQMYVDMHAPPGHSRLNNYVEDHLNTSTQVGVRCENSCKTFLQAEKSEAVVCG